MTEEFLTILILEKLTRPSSVKLGVPSSMNARSVRYMPRYGTHGGLQLQTQTQWTNQTGFKKTETKSLYFSLQHFTFSASLGDSWTSPLMTRSSAAGPSAPSSDIKHKPSGMYSPCFLHSCFKWADSDLFADFGPRLLQPVDGAAVQSGGDLQHAVVVVEAATDVGHRQPLFYGAGPGAHVGVGHNLRRHQVTHLRRREARETQTCQLITTLGLSGSQN